MIKQNFIQNRAQFDYLKGRTFFYEKAHRNLGEDIGQLMLYNL